MAEPPPRTALLPSVIGVEDTDTSTSLSAGLGDLDHHRRTLQPDRVAFDGVGYLVGDGAARFARPVERMDFQRLSDGPELRALVHAALCRLLGRGEHSTNIMLGLPVEVMADLPPRVDMKISQAGIVSKLRK